LQAYTAVIHILSHIASVGLEVKYHHALLKQHSIGLAGNAAACAIELGEVEYAVEMLQAGCSIFWQQSLQLQTSLDKLQAVRPDLTNELHSIGRALEAGSFQTSFLSTKESTDLEKAASHT
jgi:hypothetical protein